MAIAGSCLLTGTVRLRAQQPIGPDPQAPARVDTPVDPAQAALWDAAMNGKLADVKAAIAAKAAIDQPAGSRMTALGIAALYGHADIVSALLAAGAKVDSDQDGESALMIAAREGHVSVIDALLAAGADVKNRDSDGMTALMTAAAANRAAAVSALIAKGADVNATSTDGASALTAAAFGGHLEAVRALIAGGANVNAKDSSQRTPLMAAALGGNADVARALLDAKADLQAADVGGGTALIYAAANGHLAFIDLLTKAGLLKGGDMAMAFAVRGCHTPIVRRLLDAGVPTTAKLQGTPMMVLAAGTNCADAIDLLLSRGAKVDDADDEEGMTALMTAAKQGFEEIVAMLLAKGADMELTNKGNQSAWLLAAMNEQREVVEILRAQREKKGLKPPR